MNLNDPKPLGRKFNASRLRQTTLEREILDLSAKLATAEREMDEALNSPSQIPESLGALIARWTEVKNAQRMLLSLKDQLRNVAVDFAFIFGEMACHAAISGFKEAFSQQPGDPS